MIEINGEKKTIIDWAGGDRTKALRIARRIREGWEPEKAINTPPVPENVAVRRASKKSPWRGQRIKDFT